MTICTTVRSETCSSDRTTSNLSPSPNWIPTLSSGLKTGFLESLLCRFVLFPHSAPGRDQIVFFFYFKIHMYFPEKVLLRLQFRFYIQRRNTLQTRQGGFGTTESGKTHLKMMQPPIPKASSVSRAPAL